MPGSSMQSTNAYVNWHFCEIDYDMQVVFEEVHIVCKPQRLSF